MWSAYDAGQWQAVQSVRGSVRLYYISWLRLFSQLVVENFCSVPESSFSQKRSVGVPD